ncbi:MAG TPA: type II toxin-antitoxin system VapC family toxin [Oculatellaceae cyanobacterium]
MYMTDTHPLIHFFANANDRLSAPVKRTFDEALTGQSAIFVPVAVTWELSMLVETRKIRIKIPFSSWLDQMFAYSGINLYPFDLEAVKLFHDTRFHTDPFDRLIVATALQAGLPLITNDTVIHQKRPCTTFW